jgi:hypothetical protein
MPAPKSKLFQVAAAAPQKAAGEPNRVLGIQEPSDAATALWRVLGALERGLAPAPDDAAWLAAGLRRYREGAPLGETLERSLGLAPAVGSLPWWRREAQARRNTALRAIARELLAEFTTAAQANEIAAALRGQRLPRADTLLACRAAAVRPLIRRRLAELVGKDWTPLSTRHIQRILSAPARHQLPEEMSDPTCHGSGMSSPSTFPPRLPV